MCLTLLGTAEYIPAKATSDKLCSGVLSHHEARASCRARLSEKSLFFRSLVIRTTYYYACSQLDEILTIVLYRHDLVDCSLC